MDTANFPIGLMMYSILEEEAQQREAVLAVQREMEDADELNYLDEEGTVNSVLLEPSRWSFT